MENSATPQAFNYGFGPYVDGMWTQSALGIVTKMVSRIFRGDSALGARRGALRRFPRLRT